ncbi:hypothetical protein [Varunaivibrio sulfuroxidans]|nr:hypothetical protein [Varunaivibrio sulfuroxidans]
MDLMVNEDGLLYAWDWEPDAYIVDINTGHVELVSGPHVVYPEEGNALIRQLREDRLNAEWGWFKIGAVAFKAPPPVGDAADPPECKLRNCTEFRDHDFEKYALTPEEPSELNARTRKQFSGHIEDTIDCPAQEKALSGGRRAYWCRIINIVVIKNSGATDSGVAFRPLGGRAYFEGLR